MGINEVEYLHICFYLLYNNSKKEKGKANKSGRMLKILLNNLTDSVNKQQYDVLKYELDETYDKVVKGVIDKTAWQKCKEGEMSSDFFCKFVERDY